MCNNYVYFSLINLVICLLCYLYPPAATATVGIAVTTVFSCGNQGFTSKHSKAVLYSVIYNICSNFINYTNILCPPSARIARNRWVRLSPSPYLLRILSITVKMVIPLPSRFNIFSASFQKVFLMEYADLHLPRSSWVNRFAALCPSTPVSHSHHNCSNVRGVLHNTADEDKLDARWTGSGGSWFSGWLASEGWWSWRP